MGIISFLFVHGINPLLLESARSPPELIRERKREVKTVQPKTNVKRLAKEILSLIVDLAHEHIQFYGGDRQEANDIFSVWLRDLPLEELEALIAESILPAA